MKAKVKVLEKAVIGALCAVGVAACGGGGGDAATAPSATGAASVPTAASSSIAALVTWASQLPQSDVSQPLATDSFKPPVDDTAQPVPILM